MSAPIGTFTKPDDTTFCPCGVDVDVVVPDTKIVAVDTEAVAEVVDDAAVDNGSHNCCKSFADERLDLLVFGVTKM
jgi:hypothetical protein